MARTSTARKQKRNAKAKTPKVVRRKAIAARSVARNSTAQKQKRTIKAKAPKIVRRRAMAARIGVADTKQHAADVRASGGMEKAIAGRMDLPRDRAPPNDRPPAGVMDQPSGAPIAERQNNPESADQASAKSVTSELRPSNGNCNAGPSIAVSFAAPQLADVAKCNVGG